MRKENDATFYAILGNEDEGFEVFDVETGETIVNHLGHAMAREEMARLNHLRRVVSGEVARARAEFGGRKPCRKVAGGCIEHGVIGACEGRGR